MRQKISILLIALCLTIAPGAMGVTGPSLAVAREASAPEITASEAWAMWKAHPRETIILDVRSPEEFMLVGHPPMAYNIPIMTIVSTHKRITMKPNPDFVSQVTRRFDKEAPLLLMCRSGSRSTHASKMLKKAGFTKIYNVIDGFEGIKEKRKENPDFGKRVVNGWKNSEAPWTYDLNTDRLHRP